MPSDSGDHHRRTTTTKPHHLVAPPPEPEHLPCPRCDSTNTKFCYYNNYNFSQPRHFCKACRRYWTHGGTLRDIPVGGGNRKNAKRSRVTTASHNFSIVPAEYRHMAPPTATPIMIPFAGDHGGALNFLGDGKLGASMWGSFTSLLNSTQGPGFFGHGVGGFEDASFGLGRSTWPFTGVGDDGVAGHATANGGGGSLIGGGNTWQMESGDCFAMPDIAMK